MTKTNLNTIPVENDKLEDIIAVLKAGGLILYPTDTIWGIGCDATNAEAVQKVFALKNRSLSKPFILLADSIEMVKRHVVEVHPRMENLLLYHTRPLTVVYPQAKNLPSISADASGSVAMRIATDAFCRSLIKAFGRPLVSTSANISHEPFPANFGEISSAVIQGVNYVVKSSQYDKTMREPSVIVQLGENGEFTFLRE